MSHSTSPADKFANFNIISTTYKKVGTHEISVDIIVPKSIASGKRPVIARFHGGFLVSTSSLLHPPDHASLSTILTLQSR